MMDVVEVLESLNPLPEHRGNPGPPVADEESTDGIGKPRTLVLAGVASLVVALIIAGGFLVRQTSDPVELETAAVQPSEDEVVADETAATQPATQPPRGATDEPGEELAPTDGDTHVAGSQEGQAIARLIIPSINVDQIVVEGVGVEPLRRGPGHYPASPLPGQPGNAALAGHRTTFGSPFNRLDEIEAGDEIFVTTAQGTFRYVATETSVVEASEVAVLRDFGDNRLTLTTGHPEFGNQQRIVVAAQLVGEPAPAVALQDLDTLVVEARTHEESNAIGPLHVRATPDGFAGLALAGSTASFPQDIAGELQLLVSADGREWIEAPTTFDTTARSAIMTEHSGSYHIVALRLAEAGDVTSPNGNIELVHFISDDLVTWDEQVRALPEELEEDVGTGGGLFLESVVAADSGLLLSLRSLPDFGDVQQAVAELGYGAENICDRAGSSRRATIRLCGTTERIVVDLPDGERVNGGTGHYLLFAAGDEPFESVGLPEQADEGVDFFNIYPTETGFGVTAQGTFESDDGRTWSQVNTGRDVRAMMAVRGSERVFRTPHLVARSSADDPAIGMGYSPDDGATWANIDLLQLYGDTSVPVFYSQLTAGDAGWALVAQRRIQVDDIDGLERDRGRGPSDFRLSADGYVLEGETPFGPAVLRDTSGEVVRRWSHLEVTNPRWSGFQVIDGDVTLLDAGNPLVTFRSDQWGALVEPDTSFEFDVIFSADGRDWSIVDTATSPSQIETITDSELVVTRFHGGHYSSPSLSAEVIELPTADN